MDVWLQLVSVMRRRGKELKLGFDTTVQEEKNYILVP